MAIVDVFLTYIHYLIHPFKTHESFLNSQANDSAVKKLSAYESLSTSWVFVILNGIARVFLLNMILVMIAGFIEEANLEMMGIFNLSEMTNYSFLILSAVLDIIFYPLFGLFVIQYWEIVIKFVGKLIHTPGDVAQKANEIVSVYFASNILRVIPFFGAMAQSLAAMILMYAGLRVQLKASPALSVCVILSPLFLLLVFFSIFMLMFALAASAL